MKACRRPSPSVLAVIALVATPAALAQRIPEEWVGRYQAQVVSASSGMDGDQVSTFGQGMTQTTITLQTLACAQQFEMQIDRQGRITGRGRIMYVYQGRAANPATMLAPGVAGYGPGGFAVNLKDGRQFRDWTFTGSVDAQGNVEIEGIPEEPLEYINVGKRETRRPWSALPPIDKSRMRGPFRMKLAPGADGRPEIRVDQFLQLDDRLIRRVRYQAYIFRSDSNVTPVCRFDVPPPAKCPATEYIKVKSQIGVDGGYTVESSRDMKSGETTVTSRVGGSATGGFASDSAGNLSWEGGTAAIAGSMQFNPTDGSYSMSLGVGLDTSALVPGPARLSEKIEIVYDSACGWGVRGSAGVTAGAAASGVEGAIFFNKGL